MKKQIVKTRLPVLREQVRVLIHGLDAVVGGRQGGCSEDNSTCSGSTKTMQC
jgi:hypothetical protein